MDTLIYIADDEQSVLEMLLPFFVREGYSVRSFPTGDDLLAACEKDRPDLVILDVMMPGTDGLSVCAALRRAYPLLPIIILSAKNSPYDRVTGLTVGCDDYLSKPFLPMELLARVRALLRRSRSAPAEPEPVREMTSGPLTLFPERRLATLDGKPLSLTPTEFDFVALLMARNGAAVSREELMRELWKVNWQSDTRVADDLVKRLRKKLRERGNSVKIETVWGYGFRLTIDGTD